MQKRGGSRSFWQIVVVICETNWIFIGLYVISRWKDEAVAWIMSRNIFSAVQAAAESIAHPVASAFAAPMVPVEVTSIDTTTRVVSLFFYMLLPVIWLVLAALIYGYDVRDDKELMRVHRRVERLGERYRAIPKFLRDFAEHFISGYRSRYLPIANGVRITLNSGVVLIVTLILGYRLIDWLAARAWLAMTRPVGPHGLDTGRCSPKECRCCSAARSRIPRPASLVEPLRICFLAAILKPPLRCPCAAEPAAAPSRPDRPTPRKPRCKMLEGARSRLKAWAVAGIGTAVAIAVAGVLGAFGARHEPLPVLAPASQIDTGEWLLRPLKAYVTAGKYTYGMPLKPGGKALVLEVEMTNRTAKSTKDYFDVLQASPATVDPATKPFIVLTRDSTMSPELQSRHAGAHGLCLAIAERGGRAGKLRPDRHPQDLQAARQSLRSAGLVQSHADRHAHPSHRSRTRQHGYPAMMRRTANIILLLMAVLFCYGLQISKPHYGDLIGPIPARGKLGDTVVGRAFEVHAEKVEFARKLKVDQFGQQKVLTTGGVWAVVSVDFAARSESTVVSTASPSADRPVSPTTRRSGCLFMNGLPAGRDRSRPAEEGEADFRSAAGRNEQRYPAGLGGWWRRWILQAEIALGPVAVGADGLPAGTVDTLDMLQSP
ncbi:hypothetical protein ACVOMV_28555 [Mesorhizobium atlanticum]